MARRCIYPLTRLKFHRGIVYIKRNTVEIVSARNTYYRHKYDNITRDRFFTKGMKIRRFVIGEQSIHLLLRSRASEDILSRLMPKHTDASR